MQGYKETDIREIKESAQKLIADDWMLVTAGDESAWNTMTASWGGLGELWGKDAAFVFIRPQRYTLEFVEKSERFTLSFFGGKFKKEMKICGSVSGRDTDKAAEAGVSPLFTDGTAAVSGAEIVLTCRKMAVQDIEPEGFIDPSIMKWYPENDFHRVYIAEIEKVYIKE